MNSTIESFLIIICGIAVGYLLKKTKILPPDAAGVLTKVIFYVTLPAVVIKTFLSTPYSPNYLLLPLYTAAYGILIFLFTFIYKPFDGKTLPIYRLSMLGFNVGLFAFPIIELLFGLHGLAIAIYLDVGNSFIVFGLAYGYAISTKQQGSIMAAIPVITKKVCTFFPFLAYIVGMALAILHVQAPPCILHLLDIPAKANSILVLLALGLVLEVHLKKKDLSFIIKILSMRYIFGLMAAALVYFIFPLPPLPQHILMLMLILPVTFSVVAYSIDFNFDHELAAKLVNVANLITIVIIFTLSLTVF